MNSIRPLAAALLLAGLVATPAWAASSASSASSEASSTSVGSLSTSVEGSSQASSGDKKVAEGEYRVIQVAASEQQPGKLRVLLRGTEAAQGEFVLVLPASTAEQAHLAPGSIVAARHQAYGLQFAAGQPRAPFYLVLDDAWYRELQTRPVTL